jgi:glutathione peroxidase
MNKLITKIKYFFLKFYVKKGIKTRPTDVTAPVDAKSFYDFKMKANNGKEIDFSSFKGKKVLIVNVASKCGYTPQYKELEELHQQYKNKLEIIGFPADNFLHQEPGNDEEIAKFCEINYGVTFPLFQKSSVKGEDQNPLFYWLSHKSENGWNSTPPVWNFTKYLINEKGELINFFSPAVSPLSNDVIKQL